MDSATRLNRIRAAKVVMAAAVKIVNAEDSTDEAREAARLMIRSCRSKISRLTRDEIMDSMGLVKVRGSVSGKIYYE